MPARRALSETWNDSRRLVFLPVCRRLHRVGLHGHRVEEPRAFGAVPDPRLRQRGGIVRAARRRVPRDDPDRGLCRRWRGAVPVRRHDARRGFCRAAPGLPELSAGRRAGRRRGADGAVARGRRLGDWPRCAEGDHRADPADRCGDQHRGARSRPLHSLCLLLPNLGRDPAGRHGWRDRADAAPQGARQAAGHGRAGSAHQGGGDGGREGPVRAGAHMTITLGHYLAVAAILFTLGILGIFINRKNVIVILMSIELILLAVNINLVAFSSFLGDLVGQVFALLVLTVAAAEAAIGLAILVVYFRNRGSIAVEDINLMKG